MFTWYTHKTRIIHSNHKKKVTASETLKGDNISTGHPITNYESEKLAYVFSIKLF